MAPIGTALLGFKQGEKLPGKYPQAKRLLLL
jgi:hypothetical protein